MQHKHAEFFTAIANGESLDNWECAYSGRECPYSSKRGWEGKINFYVSDIAKNPQNWVVRRKQATHIVNGFTVPAPIEVAPADETLYFLSSCDAREFCAKVHWSGDAFDTRWLERGLIHLTEDAAVANAKAMCGIDPTE